MLEWHVATDSGVTQIVAVADDSSSERMIRSMEDVWMKFERDVLSLHDSADWDHVRAEVWSDSARLFVFPALSPFERRTERALVTVKWPSLASVWARFDEIEDGRESDSLAAKSVDISRDIIRCVREVSPGARTNGYRVDCFIYDAMVDSFSR